MATGTASPNYAGQLTANTVDTITMSTGWDFIQVINDDTSATIWYTSDGTTPTVSGGGTARNLPPGAADTPPGLPNSTPVVFKLISSGTPKYAIQGGGLIFVAGGTSGSGVSGGTP